MLFCYQMSMLCCPVYFVGLLSHGLYTILLLLVYVQNFFPTWKFHSSRVIELLYKICLPGPQGFYQFQVRCYAGFLVCASCTQQVIKVQKTTSKLVVYITVYQRELFLLVLGNPGRQTGFFLTTVFFFSYLCGYEGFHRVPSLLRCLFHLALSHLLKTLQPTSVLASKFQPISLYFSGIYNKVLGHWTVPLTL